MASTRTGYSPPTPARSADADMSGSSGITHARPAKSRRGRSRDPSDTDSDTRLADPRGTTAQIRSRTLTVPPEQTSSAPQRNHLSSTGPAGSRPGGGTRFVDAKRSSIPREPDGIRDPQGALLREGPSRGQGKAHGPGMSVAAGTSTEYPHRGNAVEIPVEQARGPPSYAQSVAKEATPLRGAIPPQQNRGNAAQFSAVQKRAPPSGAESVATESAPPAYPPLNRGHAR